MIANIVASAPGGAVLAIRMSMGTIASWASGAEIVVSTKARVRAEIAQPLVQPVEEPDGRQVENRARQHHPEQREAHRPLDDRLAEQQEPDQAQHRGGLREQPEKLLIEPEPIDRPVAVALTDRRAWHGTGR